MRQAGGVGVCQREEKTLRRPYNNLPVPKGGCRKTGWGFGQSGLVGGVSALNYVPKYTLKGIILKFLEVPTVLTRNNWKHLAREESLLFLSCSCILPLRSAPNNY